MPVMVVGVIKSTFHLLRLDALTSVFVGVDKMIRGRATVAKNNTVACR
jgi:hypothetical protein